MIEHLKKFKSKPLSWSSISSFEYNKMTWAKKYLEGEQEPPTIEMLFGNEVGQKIASDPKFLPKVPRYKVFEQKFEATISGVPIVGFLDSFCPDSHSMHEYKTASSKSKWNHKSVQNHGQLKFYKLLIWINKGTIPEKLKCHLTYIPVRKVGNFSSGFKMELCEADPIVFEAKHTSSEVLDFANFIKQKYAEMCDFALKYKDKKRR